MSTDSPRLLETLRDAQRFGFFGPAPIEQAAAHATGFIEALGPLRPGSSIVDIGSGGGLPGLVIADHYRDCSVTLIDRRQKRTDFLAQAVRRLRYEHVEVRCGDVADLATQVESGSTAAYAAVTARGFGPPELTVRLATRLLAPSGVIVISEPPDGDRWSPGLLDELRLVGSKHGAMRRFDRTSPDNA